MSFLQSYTLYKILYNSNHTGSHLLSKGSEWGGYPESGRRSLGHVMTRRQRWDEKWWCFLWPMGIRLLLDLCSIIWTGVAGLSDLIMNRFLIRFSWCLKSVVWFDRCKCYKPVKTSWNCWTAGKGLSLIWPACARCTLHLLKWTDG